MRLATKRSLSFVSLFLFCFCSASSADATVFRDRAAFQAAAQNLSTVDFESGPASTNGLEYNFDGIRFLSAFALSPGAPIGSTNRMLSAHTIGEITFMTIYLPPGTTAVGFEQFERPMQIFTSVDSVTMTAGDGANFMGFPPDRRIQTVRVTLDAPEPTPNATLDNFTFGQARFGNDPPKPFLLTYAPTGRAAAFESGGVSAEPFVVNTPHTQNLGNDNRTRITLLVAGLRFDSASDVPLVTARAVDSQQRVFDLPVEGVGGAKNFSWLAQVVVRLPIELSGAGELNVSVTVRGVESNKARLRVT